MLQNPLLPPANDAKEAGPKETPAEEFSARRTSRRIEPLNPHQNAALTLIRQKVATLYTSEPDAKTELVEADHARVKSKHQAYMESLKQSGKSMPEIQVAWHDYYNALSDEEKHEVWHEFYEAAATAKAAAKEEHQKGAAQPTSPVHTDPTRAIVVADHTKEPGTPDRRSVADIKKTLLGHVQTQQRHKLKWKDHLKSLGFGLAAGSIVIMVFLFSFFNQVIIAPFIQPGRAVGNEPLIINAAAATSYNQPRVIIPKINVDIPVNYNVTTTNESVIESDLEGGVVHYPNTVFPGQNGNAAFFGHSSNNIFNPGKYKFAFVLLHTLVNGDTFYLTYDGKIFAYQVVAHRVVPPSDVSVLTQTLGHTATATLITCDPPGTSINRLVVTGVQVSPNPSGNAASPAMPQVAAQPATLPGNGPSLWSRFVHWLF